MRCGESKLDKLRFGKASERERGGEGMMAGWRGLLLHHARDKPQLRAVQRAHLRPAAASRQTQPPPDGPAAKFVLACDPWRRAKPARQTQTPSARAARCGSRGCGRPAAAGCAGASARRQRRRPLPAFGWGMPTNAIGRSSGGPCRRAPCSRSARRRRVSAGNGRCRGLGGARWWRRCGRLRSRLLLPAGSGAARARKPH